MLQQQVGQKRAGWDNRVHGVWQGGRAAWRVALRGLRAGCGCSSKVAGAGSQDCSYPSHSLPPCSLGSILGSGKRYECYGGPCPNTRVTLWTLPC